MARDQPEVSIVKKESRKERMKERKVESDDVLDFFSRAWLWSCIGGLHVLAASRVLGAGSLDGRLQTDPRKNYSLLVFKYVWDNREV